MGAELEERVQALEAQVSFLRLEVRGLKGREQELASLEATVRTAASQTTRAIMKVDAQIARFRREVEEYEGG